MRTAIIIIVGLAIWGVSIGLAKRFGKPGGTTMEDATLAFITLWLLASATNMWVGMTRAGYTWQEELPVFTLIFGVPAAIAYFVRRRFF